MGEGGGSAGGSRRKGRTDRQGRGGVSGKDSGDRGEDRRSEVRRGDRRQLEERRQVGASHNQTSTSLFQEGSK